MVNIPEKVPVVHKPVVLTPVVLTIDPKKDYVLNTNYRRRIKIIFGARDKEHLFYQSVFNTQWF
jgi:P pilus assembly chaperone PapD